MGLATSWRRVLVVVLAGLVIGPSGYFVTAYHQVRDWIAAKNLVLHGLSSVLTAPSGIDRSIAYDAGATFAKGE